MNLDDELQRVFADSFTEPQIGETDYWEVDTDQGTLIIPSGAVVFSAKVGDEFPIGEAEDKGGNHALMQELGDLYAGEIYTATLKHGWLARLSAPGYMDCTEWSAFDSFEAAATYLLDAYGDQM